MSYRVIRLHCCFAVTAFISLSDHIPQYHVLILSCSCYHRNTPFHIWHQEFLFFQAFTLHICHFPWASFPHIFISFSLCLVLSPFSFFIFSFLFFTSPLCSFNLFFIPFPISFCFLSSFLFPLSCCEIAPCPYKSICACLPALG